MPSTLLSMQPLDGGGLLPSSSHPPTHASPLMAALTHNSVPVMDCSSLHGSAAPTHTHVSRPLARKRPTAVRC
jgi:hypothetical protein